MKITGSYTTEAYAQRCLDLRGYVVVGSGTRLTIGSVETIDDQPRTASNAKAVVIAKTNRHDMEEQLRAMGEPEKIALINTPYFYRMLAE